MKWAVLAAVLLAGALGVARAADVDGPAEDPDVSGRGQAGSYPSCRPRPT
jgi:opacity protein-like surface antigen